LAATSTGSHGENLVNRNVDDRVPETGGWIIGSCSDAGRRLPLARSREGRLMTTTTTTTGESTAPDPDDPLGAR
jgi:hypothetical protein